MKKGQELVGTSDCDIKTIVLNMVKDVLIKVNSIHEERENLSKEIETIREPNGNATNKKHDIKCKEFIGQAHL